SDLYWTQVGGARVSPALLKTWREKGVLLRQLYGSTEAGGGWGARNDAALTAPEKCGRGGMFTEYAIRGDQGGFAPPGVPGEILVRSPCLMGGYWNNPTATREAIRDGWLHSGDLGVIDDGGNLTFIDRLKDIIISGGLNISAAEVERAIGEVAGVEEVAVIAAPDSDFGETPLAVIFGDAKQLSVPAVIDHCNRELANFKVPRYVVLESEPLPRLPSGKISKPLLREKYKNATTSLAKVR
ncbi:MAG: AMP-binding protein, partial [Steroidobacteraceae bacterium]